MNIQKLPRQNLGFTLVELLVTLSITAILVSVAVPSFQTTISNSRINTLNDSLATFMRGARSESINRSATITVCPSKDQNTCSGDWSDGWIMFSDSGADRTFDAITDELIKASESTATNYTVNLLSDVTSSFQFNSEGRATTQGTFRICSPDKKSEEALGIVIHLSGGLRYATDTNADGIKESHSGANFSC